MTAERQTGALSGRQRNDGPARIAHRETLNCGSIVENEHIYSRTFVARKITRGANHAGDQMRSKTATSSLGKRLWHERV
jgi:hypothetical protein